MDELLENEIQQDAWLITPFSLEILFDTNYETKPHRAAATLGIDINLIGPKPGHG